MCIFSAIVLSMFAAILPSGSLVDVTVIVVHLLIIHRLRRDRQYCQSSGVAAAAAECTMIVVLLIRT